MQTGRGGRDDAQRRRGRSCLRSCAGRILAQDHVRRVQRLRHVLLFTRVRVKLPGRRGRIHVRGHRRVRLLRLLDSRRLEAEGRTQKLPALIDLFR